MEAIYTSLWNSRAANFQVLCDFSQTLTAVRTDLTITIHQDNSAIHISPKN